MILYNTSFHVVSTIEGEFLKWLKDVVIPTSISVGFQQPILTRLLTAVDADCSAFALQFLAEDLSLAQRWETGERQHVVAEMHKRWGENALAFSTIMEVIDL